MYDQLGSDRLGQDAASERTQTLVALAKFCRAISALVDPKTMPGVQLAMLALLEEIDDELKRVEASLHRSARGTGGLAATIGQGPVRPNGQRSARSSGRATRANPRAP